jgi:hypothetical protein
VEHAKNAPPRVRELEHLICPSDPGKGVFTVLDELNAPMGDVATNSYAGCFGAYDPNGPNRNVLINTDPESGNGLFHRNSYIKDRDVTDGLTNTIAVGERAAYFAKGPWAGVMAGGTIRTTPGAPVYASTIELAPTMVLARAGKWPLNSRYSEPYDFFSPHGQIIHFLFADASVQTLSGSTNHAVFHAVATRQGEEALGGPF